MFTIFSEKNKTLTPAETYIEALKRLVHANNDTGGLIINLIENYLVNDQYDKNILVDWIYQHLASVLQKSARTRAGGHLLDLLNKKWYEDKPETTEKVNKLKTLLTKQYGNYFTTSAQEGLVSILPNRNINGNLDLENGEEIKLEGTEEQYNNFTVKNYSTLKIDTLEDYESPSNRDAFLNGKSSAIVLGEIINKMQSKTVTFLPIAMGMMYAYIDKFKTEKAQLALLEKISANLHIFLCSDARTPHGRSILHILAACDRQDKKAAMIMHTLLNHFEPIKHAINLQDSEGNTALHIAATCVSEKLRVSKVAEMLLEFDAKPELLNNEGKKTSDYLDKAHVYMRSILVKKPPNMDIPPTMPNLYNETQDNGTAIMGAAIRLIRINERAKASEVLTHFFNSDTYPNKIDALQGYMRVHPNEVKIWNDYCRKYKNSKGLEYTNIINMLVCADYNNKDEAQKALDWLNKLLPTLDAHIAEKILVKQAIPAILKKLISEKSSSSYTHAMLGALIAYGPQLWSDLQIASSSSYDEGNISKIIIAVATSQYKTDDDARRAINFLDYLFRLLGPEIVKSAIDYKETAKSYSAAGHIINAITIYGPHMLALLQEHKADMQLAQGANNLSPEQLYNSMKYTITNKSDQATLLNMQEWYTYLFLGDFDLNSFRNPEIVTRYKY